MLGPTKKNTPRLRTREPPQQNGRIKPHNPQGCSKGSNKPCAHQRSHRDPTDTETELCLSVSCRGMGQQWPAAEAGALGTADMGMA